MGAVLSLPLLALPGAGAAMSCIGSCCATLACSAVGKVCSPVQDRIMKKAGYGVILVLNSLISWILLTDWAFQKLHNLSLGSFNRTCHGKSCYSFVGVQRVNFALFLFHAVLAAVIAMARSPSVRRSIHQEFWGLKIFSWLGLIAASFFIPDGFFIFWGNHVAFYGGILYLVMCIPLLMNLIAAWRSFWLDDLTDENRNVRVGAFAGFSVLFYAGALTMNIVMLVYFGSSGCTMNQVVIWLNMALMVVASYVSVLPQVQENSDIHGIGPTSIICLYCSYLIMSAVATEPDDRNCNPLIRANGTRTATIVLGAIATFVTLAYTTTNAASALSFDSEPAASSRGDGLPLTTTSSRQYRDIYNQQIDRAVREGALSEASVQDMSKGRLSRPLLRNSHSTAVSESGGSEPDDTDGEDAAEQEYYPRFHLVFMLAAMWVATLLKMNISPEGSGGELVAVGRTYWYTWVKIVTSWAYYLHYVGVLVYPTNYF